MKQMLAMLALFGAIQGPAWAGEDENKARAIYEKQQRAVVTVQLVIKQKFSFGGGGGEDSEHKAEITGTIISPDGLTVVSLAETDPSAMFSNFMPEDSDSGFKVESAVSDVKILLDEKEIDAGIVLRDKDLDLAFVRPKAKPEAALPFIDLAEPGTVQLLDRVVTINRLGKVANRTASLSFETIEAVVSKPRTFYFPGSAATMTGTGSPAFTLEGKPLGVFVTRTITGKGGGSFDMDGSHAVVILPVADIVEGASQAPPFGEEPAAAGPQEEAAPADAVK